MSFDTCEHARRQRRACIAMSKPEPDQQWPAHAETLCSVHHCRPINRISLALNKRSDVDDPFQSVPSVFCCMDAKRDQQIPCPEYAGGPAIPSRNQMGSGPHIE